jgi:hypothetical protein
VTLNQTILKLKEICLSHKQVRHFYFGDPAEWMSLNKEYPSILLTLRPLRIVPNGVEMDFTFYLSDLVQGTPEDVNESNHANDIEAQSDMISVVNDLYAEIDFYEEWMIRNENWTVNTYADMLENDDRVAGCVVDFTLFVKMAKNRCEIPYE